ncbi:MAG: amidohydrolase family protein [Bryobacterales bacterium]|nr:amidohydrolase family protein [Bryobacteraceae bacterium]MDW8131454.1 amidohydrolase family protein [Bryobacterales bacterium]
MSGLLLVRGARQLLTLRGPAGARRGPALGELGIIEDGAVLIRQGVIVSVGPARRVENLREAREADVIEAAGRVVMPGLVDCHAHFVPGRVLRIPQHPPGRPLLAAHASQWSAAFRSTSRSRTLWECRRWLHQLLRHGTTAVEIKAGWGLETATELKLMRVLAHLRDGPVDLVSTYSVREPQGGPAREPAAYLEFLLAQLFPVLVRRRLARFIEMPSELGGCDGERLYRCLAGATALGFPVKVHAVAHAQPEAVAMAVNLGAASVEALTSFTASMIASLAASPVIVTLLPALCLAGEDPGAAAVRELIRSGAAVALATGYGDTPTFSVPTAIAMACLFWELAPAEAITAATVNAACALGLQSRLGSLEPGKQADLVIFDVPDYREIPYHLGVNLVKAVVKRGEPVYRCGEILCSED